MTVWYALKIPPQKEFAAKMILERRGYTVFLPTEQKWRRVNSFSKKRRLFEYPLFVRYLFVAFKGPVPWFDLFRLNVITGVVGRDGLPGAIAHEDIERLAKLSSASVPHTSSINPHRALRTGDLAEITKGAFIGHIVKIEGLNGKKARIFLDLFGTPKEVEIDIEKLDAA